MFLLKPNCPLSFLGDSSRPPGLCALSTQEKSYCSPVTLVESSPVASNLGDTADDNAQYLDLSANGPQGGVAFLSNSSGALVVGEKFTAT